MANYRTHAVFNICCGLPATGALIVYWMDPSSQLLLILTACFLYGTFFMSPDVDVANKIKLWSVRGLLTLPYRSYAIVFKHRGISHSLLFGTLTRLFWMGGIVLLMLFLTHCCIPSQEHMFHFFHNYSEPLFYGFAGLFFADASHLLLDNVS